jgi:uncharacterized RDD family membrane protein YckC
MESAGAENAPSMVAWRRRAAATIIDVLVTALLAFAAMVVIMAIAYAAGASDADIEDGTGMYLMEAAGAMLGMLSLPLLACRAGAVNGQTIGKQLMAISAVRCDGRPLRLRHAVLRELVIKQLLVASTLGIFAVVDAVWALRDGDRRCLHDKIAATRVISASAARARADEGVQPPVDAALASWWQRAAASVIDVLTITFGSVAVVVAGGRLLGGSDLAFYIAASAMVVGIVLYPVVLAVRSGDRNGQTLGKQLMGIRVVCNDGTLLRVRRALLREIVGRRIMSILTLGVWPLVDLAWPLINRHNQALHDRIAATYVVRVEAARQPVAAV